MKLKEMAAAERIVKIHVKSGVIEDADSRGMMVRVSLLFQKGLTSLQRLADELHVAIDCMLKRAWWFASCRGCEELWLVGIFIRMNKEYRLHLKHSAEPNASDAICKLNSKHKCGNNFLEKIETDKNPNG